ncbi:hypothetical protein PsYK624_097790 [Phanerochaete sordida]|uniref:Uncharacterized protein n=1 Tax=Phanerochaete sordida TaxID=48140 RepID=A0A9P3GHC0_9APHY|nr:hypothetical protein PsYK624_097790 [Phanerochaete sordida]
MQPHTPAPHPLLSHTPHRAARTLFLLLAPAAFGLIYFTPPARRVLLPTFAHVRATRAYPDGPALRTVYTGLPPLDALLAALVAFFSATVDGADEPTRLFCVWFVPQLAPLLVLLHWEAGRVGGGWVARPTLFALAAQLVTAGAVLPLYFAAHLAAHPPAPAPPRAQSAGALAAAVALGFLLPSAALFLVPAGPAVSLDAKQVAAALWQPFPLYVAAIYRVLRPAKDEGTRTSVQRAYTLFGLLAAAAHWAVLAHTLRAPAAGTSFAHVFVPYPLHAPLGVAPAPGALPAYRRAVRLLLQEDCLCAAGAAYAWFGYVRWRLARGPFARWAAAMVFCTLVGGPGAAVAWAAVDREEAVGAVKADAQVEVRGCQFEEKRDVRVS